MGDRTSNREGKVRLEPGYSQIHWMMLTQRSRDLSGLNGQPPRRNIPREEVALHNTEHDCWSILDGKVYNFTPYMRYHPGGIQKLMLCAGGDCTTMFNESHAWVNGHGMLEKCYIGTVAEGSVSTAISNVALSAVDWRPFKLVAVRDISAMTKLFQFELPPGKTLGLTVPGQHLRIRVSIDGKLYERAYTPVSAQDQKHTFDIIVKVYPDGIVSSHLANLSIGSVVRMIGPQGTFGYSNVGEITVSSIAYQNIKHIAMIAGGSGITPLLQLIRAVMQSKKRDPTKLSLINCNRSQDYVIAKTSLAPLQNMFPNQFQWLNVLAEGDEGLTDPDIEPSIMGRLNEDILQQHLPAPDTEGLFILHCGPPKFDEFVHDTLLRMGYLSRQIYQF
ncbi:nitrate reductase [Thraustotheca clavata]|uniref:Nitrate reductase n=1 Tax=Thraustotheca clavata TaxID=74557 RepID=A0A1V9ZW45_9STRA|nr:nitrate reductase [Thraustotheca clavata]